MHYRIVLSAVDGVTESLLAPDDEAAAVAVIELARRCHTMQDGDCIRVEAQEGELSEVYLERARRRAEVWAAQRDIDDQRRDRWAEYLAMRMSQELWNG